MSACLRLSMIGRRFGRLTVLAHVHRDKFRCVCSCGSFKTTLGYSLRRGLCRSCGCLQKEWAAKLARLHLQTHGLRRHRLYSIWCDMKKRCYNSRYREFRYYGGRGITICKLWREDFLSFYRWALEHGYRSTLTIERKNNDGDYTPGNCMWATAKQQAWNRRGKFCGGMGRRWAA